MSFKNIFVPEVFTDYFIYVLRKTFMRIMLEKHFLGALTIQMTSKNTNTHRGEKSSRHTYTHTHTHIIKTVKDKDKCQR